MKKQVIRISIFLAALAIGHSWGRGFAQTAPGHDHAAHAHRVAMDPDLVELNRRYEEQWTKWQQRLFDIEVVPGMTVADIGTGDGKLAMLLAARVGPQGHVFANEIAAEKINALATSSQAAGITNLTPIQGRSNNPDLPRGMVDLAVMVEVYHHLDDPQAFLDELHGQVKPGATLVIIEGNTRQGDDVHEGGCYSDPAKIRQIAEESGFEFGGLSNQTIAGFKLFVLTLQVPVAT